MDYKRIREQTQTFYKEIGEVYCPFFRQNVYFRMSGFKHLIYKSFTNRRTLPVQMQRFAVLALAKEIIHATHTLQEFEFLQIKNIFYYAFIAILNNIKIKVVVRKIGENGELQFWSVFPFYVTSKRRDEKFFKTQIPPYSGIV